MQTLRILHKWVGLLLGLQFVLWALSGAMMALIDHHAVLGDHTRRSAPPLALSASVPALSIADIHALVGPDATGPLRLRPLLDRFVYEVSTADGVRLLAAEDGSDVVVDRALAHRIAEQDYSGAGQVVSVDRMEETTLEVRNHEAPIWRVAFDDEENTTLYVAAETGRILERRNDSWRLFDFFWMLHIMDYTERQSFNHPLIILATVSAVWLSFSGLFLIFDSFSWRDFNPGLAMRRLRGRGVPVAVWAGGQPSRTVDLPEGATYFDALSAEGVRLPSNCGGGGSCGLCRVELGPDAPITDADRYHIGPQDLQRGARLACRHHVVAGAEVGVPNEALDTEGHTATVLSTRYLSPFIKEVHLRLDDGTALNYRAGQFVQLEIPAYETSPARFEPPVNWQTDWERLRLPERLVHEGGIHRSYSLATHPSEAPSELVLNVRFMPSSTPDKVPCGAGSSYVFGLRPGEKVRVFGPFGAFAASDSGREIIAIGGGAGMAPLRAIIRDELLRKGTFRRISYWYGARSARDILYRDEFDRLAEASSNFTWTVALSEPEAGDSWRGPVGLIHEVVRNQYLAKHPNLAECEFLVCGPPAMLKAVLAMLEDLGVPRDRIAFDDFGI
ncbi:NADH:ubiquinone reductase (Na(+)-transporting) subunit F [Indioceanicola profundi]|uniref:NADH:ubiquinone reductase (Na(+)-transporting) subunit F n=1 Tax=Indioceanicola profundi TaxID=2220096 RepID=UPI000E6AA547|nr:NADH:ubiquinone reductase (Na(+)-transporting) subunit F [Indioceanicola profundi]